MSIGDTLARARREAGLSITQVSQRTRIRETIIRGIENDDFSACGGDFYARGHIRGIAKTVGIDPEPLIQEYDRAHGALGQVSAAEVFEPTRPIRMRERRTPNWSAVMALAIIGVIVFVIVQAFSSSHHVNTAARDQFKKPSAAASATPPPSPTPAASQPQSSVVVQLAANQDCWVGVYSANGVEKWQGIISAGMTRSWNFTRQVSMKIGNPGGITLTVNGRSMDSLGTQPVTLNFQPGRTVSG